MGPRWSQKGQGTSVPPRLAASRALLSLAQPRVAQPSSQLKYFRALHPDGHPPAPYLGGVPMSVPALISLQTLSLCSYTGSTSHPCPLALQAGQAQRHKRRIWGSKWVLSIFFPIFFFPGRCCGCRGTFTPVHKARQGCGVTSWPRFLCLSAVGERGPMPPRVLSKAAREAKHSLEPGSGGNGAVWAEGEAD